MAIKEILKKGRVIVLLFLVFASIIAINPQFNTDGVIIKGVEEGSQAELAGILNPMAETSPTTHEKIKEINGEKVLDLQDYNNKISQINLGETIRLKTNKENYELLNTENLGLVVQNVPSNNLRKGLELQGGTRVLLQPEVEVTDQQRDELIQVMTYRLNTYGLSDVKIKKSDDLLGNKYILVEIAGATEQEVKDLIASQGVFEARISNQTVFGGGSEDITYVCRNDGTCAGIRDCSTQQDGTGYCKFEFQIQLTQQAANNFAAATADLTINISEAGHESLSEPIELYLDNVMVDSLNIAASLKGVAATTIIISGPGYGANEQEALLNSLENMNKLQTILITGSFPFKLDIVKLDTISPVLGAEFVKNAILAGLLAMLAVGAVIFIRFRKWKITIPVLITLVSELIIILGFAAISKQNLDLAAIAGIIAAIGTGVDDQIVIIDEVLAKHTGFAHKWKEKIKKAFFIIMAAYLTTLVAMLPLFNAGAGMIRGFALIIIVGISIGVFFTRPAFAAMMEVLNRE
jgi:preprotein translocase subunit SecD